MGFRNRKTWSRRWRTPRKTIISNCNYQGPAVRFLCPGERLGLHFPETAVRVEAPVGDEELYANLRVYHGYVADLMYYAKWYSENMGSQRRARIEKFGLKCYERMRYMAARDGSIPSEGSLYWHMLWLADKQNQLICDFRGVDYFDQVD